MYNGLQQLKSHKHTMAYAGCSDFHHKLTYMLADSSSLLAIGNLSRCMLAEVISSSRLHGCSAQSKGARTVEFHAVYLQSGRSGPVIRNVACEIVAAGQKSGDVRQAAHRRQTACQLVGDLSRMLLSSFEQPVRLSLEMCPMQCHLQQHACVHTIQSCRQLQSWGSRCASSAGIGQT